MKSAGRKPLWLRFFLVATWLLLAGLCLATGSLFGFVGRSKVMSESIVQTVTGETPQKVFEAELKGTRDYLNVLILGCDEDRLYAGDRSKPGSIIRHASRSDMMLVAKIDFGNKRISGISIPRDLLWEIPGYRPHKINAFHKIGVDEGGPEKGKELAKQAAEGVVGLPIDRVVVLNYQAFQKMIDKLGGIEVFVPRNMDYDDKAGDLHIHLKKGRQRLSGYDAMCFVRYRHNDSDFKRQDRQKDLMMAVKDRALEKWQQAPEVADTATEILGKAFTAREVASLALFGRKVGGDNIKMTMVPVLETPGSTNLQVDTAELSKKLRELKMMPTTIVTIGE